MYMSLYLVPYQIHTHTVCPWSKKLPASGFLDDVGRVAHFLLNSPPLVGLLAIEEFDTRDTVQPPTRAISVEDLSGRISHLLEKKADEKNTLLVLALEFLRKVVDKTVVKVLTTQVSGTGGGLDLEDTLLDGEERHIEGSSTEIEDEDVTARQ
ncbi:hypothetical protein C8R47DRAFT_469881 [Mycena vitilis]|nr:hypothetical protein C8R47DRAFT_469881 [Mycena vitilis]